MNHFLEVWLPVKGYEGRYLISNYGRVNRLYKNGKNIILAGSWGKDHRKKTYRKVNLYKNAKFKSFYVHRLVAQHFVSNCKEAATVNHIDGDKLNNFFKNLEWLTLKENIHHAIKQGLMPQLSPKT